MPLGVILFLCSSSRVIAVPLKFMACLVSGSWPHLQCQLWVAVREAGLQGFLITSVPLLHQRICLADRLLLQATEVELYEVDDDFLSSGNLCSTSSTMNTSW